MEFKRDSESWTDKAIEWIDGNLPQCPLCGMNNPLWEHAIKFDATGTTRYHYRCPRCLGVFSIPMNDVTHTFSTWPSKQDDHLRLEDKGSVKTTLVVGKEYDLTSLKEMARSLKASK